MITGQFSDLGFLIAERTGRILLHREEPEFDIQGIIDQKLADQRFSNVQDEFDRLCRLKQPNLPGYNSQDARLVSAGD